MSALAVVTKPADQRTDDVDLVAAVRAGDDRAFEVLFVRYQARIAAYVRGMVRDHERAEDITQEVFIAALRRLRATETPIAFKPWIYEIAKNACIDAFRRARRMSELPFDDHDLDPSIVAHGDGPEAAVDAKLALDNLCGAFGGLSQMHHDILVMREFEDLSYREIGDRLGMSRAAVESTLFRARRRLSEEYEELVSGERCLRVRALVDAPPGRAPGMRDQRRMARHLAHCQPCRRYAHAAGVDLDVVRAPVTARIAALIPLPAFVRRRFDLDDGSALLGHHGGSAAQWSKVVAVLDPATVSGWPRAIAAAATVAVAGLGAGAAVGERPRAVIPTGGAKIAPVLAAPQAVRPGASRASGQSASSGSSVAKPSGPVATRHEGDGEATGGAPSGEPAPVVGEGAPGSGSGSAPAARPHAAPAGTADSSPGNGRPAVDPTAGGASGPLGEGQQDALIDGVGTAVDGDDATVPDTLGDVLGSLGDALGQQGSGVTEGAPSTGSAPVTAGPLETAVGQVLDAAGLGER